jgi:hypothetical protein
MSTASGAIVAAAAGIFDDFSNRSLAWTPETWTGRDTQWGVASCQVFSWMNRYSDTYGTNPDGWTTVGVTGGEGWLHPEPIFGPGTSGNGFARVQPQVEVPNDWQQIADPDEPSINQPGYDLFTKMPFAIQLRVRFTALNPNEAVYDDELPWVTQWTSFNFQAAAPLGAVSYSLYPRLQYYEFYSNADDPVFTYSSGHSSKLETDPAIGWYFRAEFSVDPAWADVATGEDGAASGSGSCRSKFWPVGQEEPPEWDYIGYLDSRYVGYDGDGGSILSIQVVEGELGNGVPWEDVPSLWVDYGTKLWCSDIRIWQNGQEIGGGGDPVTITGS